MTPDLLEGFRRAVESSQCTTLLSEELSSWTMPEGTTVLSIGKSASAMARAVEPAADRLDVHLFTAPTYVSGSLPDAFTLHEGEHPVPDHGSFKSGEAVLSLVKRSRQPVFLFLSGGGSSLVEAPLKPWFSETDIRNLNAMILRSPLGINEINVLRKHFSAIKGGRLACAADQAVHTFIFSDVPRGRLDVVASGPTIPDPSSCGDAVDILRRLGEEEMTKPWIERLSDPNFPETPGEEDPTFIHNTVRLLADNSTFLKALSEFLSQNRIHPVTVIDNGDMPVEEAAGILFDHFSGGQPGHAFLAGGEFTYALPPSPGTGGRCLHFAAVFSDMVLRHLPDRDWVLLAAASDGHDGAAESGGVMVSRDRLTCSEDVLKDVIDRADTFDFWKEFGTVIPLTPTEINLRDAFVLVCL